MVPSKWTFGNKPWCVHHKIIIRKHKFWSSIKNSKAVKTVTIIAQRESVDVYCSACKEITLSVSTYGSVSTYVGFPDSEHRYWVHPWTGRRWQPKTTNTNQNITVEWQREGLSKYSKTYLCTTGMGMTNKTPQALTTNEGQLQSLPRPLD